MDRQGGFSLTHALVLLTVAIAIGGAGLVVWKKQAMPTCDASFKLGQVFTLGKGCYAKLVGADFEVGVIEFYNHPCPKDVECISSGQNVVLEYTSNGVVRRDNAQAFGYEVHQEDTDYATFVKLSVKEIEQ